jgi:hypothetical protein
MLKRMRGTVHLGTEQANISQMTKIHSFVSILALLSCLTVSAQFTKYSNEFMDIGAGARGMAMGNAVVASVSDGTAGYWNPAALANIRDVPQLNLMHAEYFAGIGKYDFANLVLPLKDKKRTIGLTLLRFAVDDIPNTIFLVNPDGSVNYANITTFSSADYAFLLSLAQQNVLKNGDKFNFGGNVKIIHQVAGGFANSWGFGFDVATQVIGKGWQVGIVAKDVTTTFNAWSFNINQQMQAVFDETENMIPGKSIELTAPQLIIGGDYNFKFSKKVSLLVEADLDVTFDGQRNTVISGNPVSIAPMLGLELSFKDVFFVRAGVNNFQQVLDDKDTTNQRQIWIYQPSAGAGFKVGNVQIDYAFTNLANQSYPLYTNVFSIKVDINNNKKKKPIKR